MKFRLIIITASKKKIKGEWKEAKDQDLKTTILNSKFYNAMFYDWYLEYKEV